MLHEYTEEQLIEFAREVNRARSQAARTVPFVTKQRVAEARRLCRCIMEDVKLGQQANALGKLETLLIVLDEATRFARNETPASGNDEGSEEKNTKAPTV